MTAPPIPPDADLRGLRYMPLHVARLLDSDFFALASGDEFKAALSLWAKAWHQVPAGSLPDDDRILAHLSGAGANWQAVRDVALHGWQRHDDGRLYHAVVTEVVLEALATRKAHAAKTAAATAAKRARASVTSSSRRRDDHRNDDVNDNVTTIVTTVKRIEEKGIEQKVSASSLRSDDAVPASVHPVTLPRNVRDELWQAGLPIIRELTGLPEAKARAMLGRMLKAAGDDCAKVLRAIREAADTRPVDPAAWLMAACKPQTGNPFLAVARDAAAQRAPPLLIEGLAAIEKLGGSKG